FHHPHTTQIYTLSLHDALPISWLQVAGRLRAGVSLAQARSGLEIVARQIEQEAPKDRAGLQIRVTQWRDTPDQKYKLTLIFVLRSEEHTSELQSRSDLVCRLLL